MCNDRLTELLSRKLSGEATPAELQELHLLLQAKPGDQYFTEILSTYWHNRNDHAENLDQQADQHFAHILEMAAQEPETTVEMYPEPGRTRFIKKLAIAAAIAVIVSIGIWMTLQPAAQNNIAATIQKKSEVVAGKGIRSKLVLPDGTQVWLNSDSRLLYDEAFDGKQREVTLQGEAYFDVTKNPDRPFIVHTSAIDIRVLGTAFNVKSYPAEKTIETTLIHGLVEVINKNRPDASKIILRPKEKLVFNKINATMIQNTSGGNIIPAGDNNSRGNIEAISITALPKTGQILHWWKLHGFITALYLKEMTSLISL